jgi:hypothetical protein
MIAAMLALALPVAAHAQPESGIDVQRLEQELARRDAIIADLLDRVRALEAGRAASGPAADQPQPAAGSASPDTVSETATTSGDFAVDRLAAERALERSLVQQGARLLDSGRFELTPEFTFSRFEADFPALLLVGGDSRIGAVEQRLSASELGANLRIGLPFDAQLEIGVPYRIVRLQTRTRVGGTLQSSDGRTGSGLGDIEVGLAKSIAAQHGWQPQLVGRLVWTTGPGKEFDNAIFLGGGTSALSGQLTASWRSDPIVFFVSGGYTRYLSNDVLDRSDGVALSLGGSLAISPETALLLSLDQSYTGAADEDEVQLPRTDRLASILNLSAATIVGRGVLLRVNMGIGLTDDSPGYFVGLTLPVRW